MHTLFTEVLNGHIDEEEVKVETRDVPDEFNNSIVTVPPPFMHTRIQSIADGKTRLREVPTPEIPINCQPIRVEDLRAYVEKGKLAECFLFKKEYKVCAFIFLYMCQYVLAYMGEDISNKSVLALVLCSLLLSIITKKSNI